jgi:hypothetical protein
VRHLTLEIQDFTYNLFGFLDLRGFLAEVECFQQPKGRGQERSYHGSNSEVSTALILLIAPMLKMTVPRTAGGIAAFAAIS